MRAPGRHNLVDLKAPKTVAGGTTPAPWPSIPKPTWRLAMRPPKKEVECRVEASYSNVPSAMVDSGRQFRTNAKSETASVSNKRLFFTTEANPWSRGDEASALCIPQKLL